MNEKHVTVREVVFGKEEVYPQTQYVSKVNCSKEVLEARAKVVVARQIIDANVHEEALDEITYGLPNVDEISIMTLVDIPVMATCSMSDFYIYLFY